MQNIEKKGSLTTCTKRHNIHIILSIIKDRSTETSISHHLYSSQHQRAESRSFRFLSSKNKTNYFHKKHLNLL